MDISNLENLFEALRNGLINANKSNILTFLQITPSIRAIHLSSKNSWTFLKRYEGDVMDAEPSLAASVRRCRHECLELIASRRHVSYLE